MEAISLLGIIKVTIALMAILVLLVGNALVMVYVERRGAGFIQRRPGPCEVGPQGLLQPIVDSVKLLAKQFFVPANGDRIMYFLAPVVMFAPVPLLFLAFPFSGPSFLERALGSGIELVGLRLDLGLLLILAFSGVAVLALIMGGLGATNKYGLLGGARAVAQTVAYEIPMVLAVLAIAFMYGTLNLSEIVEGQKWPWQWNFLCQPLAFFIYVVSAFGETNRAPFDLPEGESELTGGFHTEYSGMGFAMFFLAEYSNMLVVSLVCATLFLGGWQFPLLPGPWWIIVKAYGLMFFMVWVRWTFPRVRFDQLLNINWKWLIPLGLLNLWLTAVIMKI